MILRPAAYSTLNSSQLSPALLAVILPSPPGWERQDAPAVVDLGTETFEPMGC